MESPAGVTKPRRPRRLRRRIFIAGGILTILLGGLYTWENRRGRRAFDEAVSAWISDGYSLQPESLLPPVVPAAENFGATPLLDGIATASDSDDPTPWKKRRFLTELMPGIVRKWDLRTAVLADSMEWEVARDALARAGMSPPAEEPAPVAAVYKALDSRAALFEELTSAAQRQHAHFTPARDMSDLRNSPAIQVASLESFLLLRARAAAATGRPEEAVKLAGVIWRLREALIAEDAQCRQSPDEYWIAAARDVCRAKERTDAMLSGLITQPGSYFSPENEILRVWNLRAARAVSDWMKYLSDSQRGLLLSSFCREWPPFDHFLAKWGPSGWHDQNMALSLRRFHDSFIKPLKQGGFPALREAMKPLEMESPDEQNTLFRMFQFQIGSPAMVKMELHRATRIRLMLLGIGMERFRLKNGIYPSAASELIPDFLDEIPPGIDGNPLSISTSPDKARSLLYSAAWDRDPAVRRDPPPSSCGSTPPGNDEWSMTLPFPAL